MAFKATSVPPLATALGQIIAGASSIKRYTQQIRDRSAAGDIPAREITKYMDEVTRRNGEFDVLKTTAGLAQYARDQFDDPAYDIVAEFNTMQTQMTATAGWISTNIPQSGGFLAIEQVVGNALVDRMLTSVQTAGLRTELDALLATID